MNVSEPAKAKSETSPGVYPPLGGYPDVSASPRRMTTLTDRESAPPHANGSWNAVERTVEREDSFGGTRQGFGALRRSEGLKMEIGMRQRGRPAKRRQQMLAYVDTIITRDGVAPSYGMICRELGIRTRGEVSRLVAAAEKSGKLSRVGSGKVRRLRLSGAI